MTDPRWMVEERQKPMVPRKMTCVKCGVVKEVQIPILAYKILVLARVPYKWICEGCDATGLVRPSLRDVRVRRDE